MTEGTDREIPMGYAFAAALVAHQTGPCTHAACPIVDGESWTPERCCPTGCPRASVPHEAADR